MKSVEIMTIPPAASCQTTSPHDAQILLNLRAVAEHDFHGSGYDVVEERRCVTLSVHMMGWRAMEGMKKSMLSAAALASA